ncbi:type II toxin-antitoxin system mRNA interferase toxin, RelE/StbE family [candidate division WWE3 bacterium]|uniref:Type II toxin-antitoxin system mRNA interferase toxin, RelE/StbE family n=1 Tax=candidate division WWE3 bacterium TaxID=2053526 RepID=A0A955LJ92_UNCKA|nr:type II toxin-antitoxin system mRNA interferase toxin, RelE/StbE family [candidate division WWE3 bacterium]
MSTHVRFNRKFVRAYRKLTPKIQKAVDSRIKLFEKQPNHPSLRNHKLSGRLSDMSSINITGDYRALFKVVKQTTTTTEVEFYLIGTHAELYG